MTDLQGFLNKAKNVMLCRSMLMCDRFYLEDRGSDPNIIIAVPKSVGINLSKLVSDQRDKITSLKVHKVLPYNDCLELLDQQKDSKTLHRFRSKISKELEKQFEFALCDVGISIFSSRM